jgi:hypothetical protein
LRIAKGDLHVPVCHGRILHVDLGTDFVVSIRDDDLRFASLVAIQLSVFRLKVFDMVAILNWHE